MRYIQSFSTSGAVQEAIENQELGRPYVAYVQDGQYIAWDSSTPPVPPEPVYSAMPLTFEIISGGTLVFKTSAEDFVRTFRLSKNGGPFETIDAVNGSGNTINVKAGDVIVFRTNNTSYATYYNHTTNIGGTAIFKAYGNLVSLLSANNFATFQPTDKYLFYGLFKDNKGIIGGKELVLPINTITKFSCNYMFYGCSRFNGLTCLATTIETAGSATGTSRWLRGVSPTGTFVKHPDANWPTGDSGIPNNWTVIDAQL